VGDINKDSRQDIVLDCSDADGEKSGVIWMSYEGEFSDWKWRFHEISEPKGVKYDRIELIDLDGDLDLLTCEERQGGVGTGLGVIWYENPTIGPGTRRPPCAHQRPPSDRRLPRPPRCQPRRPSRSLETQMACARRCSRPTQEVASWQVRSVAHTDAPRDEAHTTRSGRVLATARGVGPYSHGVDVRLTAYHLPDRLNGVLRRRRNQGRCVPFGNR